MPPTKSRAYCFTLNNPTEEDLISYHTSLQIWNEIYHVIGLEIGEQSQTPHLQGYVYFKNPISFSSMKKKLLTAHIESAKASPADNLRYCAKENYAKVYGDIPNQGKRTDIELIKEMVKCGQTVLDVIEIATSYQSIKTAEVLLKYLEKARDFKPYVVWCHGPTGSGKTKYSMDQCINPYITMNNRWWDGYDAHAYVIIDDLRSDSYRFDYLLRLLDRYPMKIEIKGGTRQFLARHIYITCPQHPEALFGDLNENLNQLYRRIDEIIEFPQITMESLDIVNLKLQS